MNHLVTQLHRRIYRLSRGRLLGRMAGQPVLLLETIGRRSGLPHETPIQYLPHDDGFVVVAANHGARTPPAWSLNLADHPRARIEVRGRQLHVRAREAEGEEREALWDELVAANRHLPGVAEKAGHELPVIVLAREAGA